MQTGDLAVVVDVDDSVVTPLRPTTRSRSSVSDLITSDSDAPIETPLVGWERRLDDLGISHGGIVDAHYGSGLSFRDPDGIALEFFAPPASDA